MTHLRLCACMGTEGPCLECIIPILFSYDCNCQYSVHVLERFRKNFPHLLPHVSETEFTIPVVHVRDHKEDCEYLYGSFYKEGGAHFHGEQAESIWAEFNHLGGRTRQMNSDHRHDVLNDHVGDWNWQKVNTLCESSLLNVSLLSIRL